MLSTEDIGKLFIVFQARYGHKWTTAYDDPDIMRVAVSEWHKELCGFRPEDIRTGLEAWTDSWPPCLPEFVAACMPDLSELGFDVDAEVRARLPSYKYLAQNAFEEQQRAKDEQSIRKDVEAELMIAAKDAIKHEGVQELLGGEVKRLLS